MPRILAYGEDALTLWALGFRLGKLLSLLEDPSPANKAAILYRPSFGRGGRRDAAQKEEPRAEFGEFDAIVGTPRRVYLIESKWEGSTEIKADRTIELRREQIRRHEIFAWYLRTWRDAPPLDWAAFVARADRAFRKEFPRTKMAPVGSRLADNLAFVLARLAPCGSETKNIILFFHFLEKPAATRTKRTDFVLIPFLAKTVPGSMYLDIALPD